MQHCLRVFDIINTPYHHPEFNYGYHIVIVSPPATPFHIRIESNQCILLSLEREVQNSFSSRSDGFISLWISRFQSECHPLFPHFYHSYQVLKSVLNSTRNEYHNHGNHLSTNIILDLCRQLSSVFIIIWISLRLCCIILIIDTFFFRILGNSEMEK